MGTYLSGRGLARAVVLFATMRIAVLVYTSAVFAAYVADRTHVELLKTVGPVLQLGLLVNATATILFLCWVYRCVANLPHLGSLDISSPSMAVWSFFIPFVNLVRPHTVMSLIWRESQPREINEHGFAVPTSTALVTAWWVTYLGCSVVTLFVGTTTATMNRTQLGDLQLAMMMLIGAYALTAVCGVVFIYMVRRVQSRQDAQWQDLVLRAQAPVPTADALR